MNAAPLNLYTKTGFYRCYRFLYISYKRKLDREICYIMFKV